MVDVQRTTNHESQHSAAESRRSSLVDRWGRPHDNLRVSVTDRCNIRCFYCMPDENVVFRPKSEILTYEEIERFVRVLVPHGIRKVRITGGEPLVRSGLAELIHRLHRIPGLDDLALTTNGMLLAQQASELRQAGLDRINISLDTLDEQVFQKITRRTGVARVLEGIQGAIDAGFSRIRLNAIAIRGLTETEIVPLAEFARERDLEIRFIEFMPLDADGNWHSDQVLDGERILQILRDSVSPLRETLRNDPTQPAVDYEFVDGKGRVGLIRSVSAPFCETCSRLRLTAEGKIRNCLFSDREWDVRDLLRSQGTDVAIVERVRECLAEKKRGHGQDDLEFHRPDRAMYQIGG